MKLVKASIVLLFGLMFLAVVAGMGTTGAAVTVVNSVSSNTAHADARHIEAPDIRVAVYEHSPVCSELYYSPSRGTVLVLCHVDGDQWGGGIFRISENMGQRMLSSNEAYECTIFVANRAYWDGVIERDGYKIPAASIVSWFADWIGW